MKIENLKQGNNIYLAGRKNLFKKNPFCIRSEACWRRCIISIILDSMALHQPTKKNISSIFCSIIALLYKILYHFIIKCVKNR